MDSQSIVVSLSYDARLSFDNNVKQHRVHSFSLWPHSQNDLKVMATCFSNSSAKAVVPIPSSF